jgi:hypothetical protein
MIDTGNDNSDNVPDPVANGTVPLPYTPPPPPPPPPPPQTTIRPVYPTDTNKPPENPLAEWPEHDEPVGPQYNPRQGETETENTPPPPPPPPPTETEGE